MTEDRQALADLAEFARLEVEAHDIEPWADLITTLYRTHLGFEEALWLLKLYNSFDDIGSAWQTFAQWPEPTVWAKDPAGEVVRTYDISRERRNLYGGRIIRHLADYSAAVGGGSQATWLARGLVSKDPFENFGTLLPHLRSVWGIGRQAGFEWAEFLAKAVDMPVETPDAYLWESSGPRESIERLYGLVDPDAQALGMRAHECREMLQREGVDLNWWDFETVICDFNVMRKGRYYPGQHLAMIKGEIEGLEHGDSRDLLLTAYHEMTPEPWASVPAGVSKPLRAAYRSNGVIATPIGGGLL